MRTRDLYRIIGQDMAAITTGIFGNAVHLFWDMHLKSCTVLVLTGLLDGDIGYGKDFLD